MAITKGAAGIEDPIERVVLQSRPRPYRKLPLGPNSRTSTFLVFVICALLLPGCAKKASDEIDYGTVKNSVYQNEYFGLNLPLPVDWNVQDQEMRRKLAETGTRLVAGDDRQMKAALKASEQQTVYLLTVFKHPVGSPLPFNPSIMCIAERIRGLPGIKRGSDYLYHARKLMEASQVKFEFPNEASSETLGGTSFDVMDASMKIKTLTVKQKYYAAVLKGYALGFVISFTSADEEKALHKILEGLSFK